MPVQRLLRRNGVYYYRRRVPLPLVKKLGRKFVQVSLHTTSLKEAKSLRTLRDLEWDAKFAAYCHSAAGPDGVQASAQPLAKTELVQLVRDYVERRDQLARKREVTDYPENPAQAAEMKMEEEIVAQTLQSRDDPQTQQWIYLAGKEVLKPTGKSIDDPDLPSETLAELVRRGLLELTRRRHARVIDNHNRTFFDQLFDPSRPTNTTFGQLAEQCLLLTQEEAEINGLSQKWVDKQRANLALIREIVGDKKPVESADYDTCLRVRTILARLPSNRTKLYGDLPIEKAIERAAKEGKPLLSSVTQQQYLTALRDVLDLAAKKRLIPVNPADGLKPIKRDAVSAGEK